jgi:hypothetical protein
MLSVLIQDFFSSSEVQIKKKIYWNILIVVNPKQTFFLVSMMNKKCRIW